MKKAIILLLCAALTLGLAACGEAAVEDSSAPSADMSSEPAPVESAAPSESAPEETPGGEASLLDTAKEYEGKPVEDLIAAIGEPVSSNYASSCLGEGEDGNLYYDGFTIYTYRDDTGETVSYVE
jgi:hypothetical protein